MSNRECSSLEPFLLTLDARTGKFDVLALVRRVVPTAYLPATLNSPQHASVQQIKIGLMDPTQPRLASGGIATVRRIIRQHCNFARHIHQFGPPEAAIAASLATHSPANPGGA
jgi:hypothetical protein